MGFNSGFKGLSSSYWGYVTSDEIHRVSEGAFKRNVTRTIKSVHSRPALLQYQQGILYAATNTHRLHKRLQRRADFIVSLDDDQIIF